MVEKTILVVDPDPTLAKFLVNVLEQEGYDVSLAESLDQALDILSGANFDLIITEAFGQTDIFHFNPAFLDELTATAPNTPIILCSVSPTTDSLREGCYGLTDVVHKPFDIDVLVKKVERALLNVDFLTQD